MLEMIAQALVAGWLLWVVGNVSVMLAGSLLVRHSGPVFNGFSVYVPKSIVEQLSARELRAVVMHEHGHRAHMHVWKNLARRCIFLTYDDGLRAQQELEADDYVTDRSALASALRKISRHPFDLRRAIRLEQLSAGSARAGDPTPGMGEHSTHEG